MNLTAQTVSSATRQSQSATETQRRQQLSRKLAELALLKRRVENLEQELGEQVSELDRRSASNGKPFRMVPAEDAPDCWPKEYGPMPDFFESCQSRKEVDDWLYFFELWYP